ncbi:peptidase M76 [Ochromonadaceae sp. CCMP2298]|nr:peptidase M76 [Ochromonadaceae sp. CCMP2298]
MHEKCNAMLHAAVTLNPKVQKMIDSIEALGCTIPKSFFICRPCDAEISGGFNVGSSQTKESGYQPQIIVCENNILEKETFEHTIVHELVHAYDVCRAKLDFADCAQHACTEIRASSMSGECSILHEVFRGKLKRLAGGQKDCVQRRAIKSLQMNPNCQAIADKAVSDAFTECYADQCPLVDKKA